jgi:hypothetical protein
VDLQNGVRVLTTILSRNIKITFSLDKVKNFKTQSPFLNETSACAKEAIKNAQSKNGSIIGHKTKNEDKENQTK